MMKRLPGDREEMVCAAAFAAGDAAYVMGCMDNGFVDQPCRNRNGSMVLSSWFGLTRCCVECWLLVVCGRAVAVVG